MYWINGSNAKQTAPTCAKTSDRVWDGRRPAVRGGISPRVFLPRLRPLLCPHTVLRGLRVDLRRQWGTRPLCPWYRGTSLIRTPPPRRSLHQPYA